MRFAFGKNWNSFLERLNENRISEAVRALHESLGISTLEGKKVLDIGSGSGLSSLALRRLGAQVVSFDYDEDSVQCTLMLRERFFGNDPQWSVCQGSVLDETFMAGLGQFDLVYAWGVLHHTGHMWSAIDRSQERVAPGGTFLVALYNDQGWRSKAWWWIKRTYCASKPGQWLVISVFYPIFALYALWLDVRHGHIPGTHARTYARHRGMSLVHDWKDWLGGFPFEVASREAVLSHLRPKGMTLVNEKLTKGWGCNEFVLTDQGSING